MKSLADGTFQRYPEIAENHPEVLRTSVWYGIYTALMLRSLLYATVRALRTAIEEATDILALKTNFQLIQVQPREQSRISIPSAMRSIPPILPRTAGWTKGIQNM